VNESQKTCTVDECGKQTRSTRSPYCEMHYYRLRRNGTTDQLKPWTRHEGACKVDDCESPVDSRWGMCQMHVARVVRHGDPLAVTHQKDRDHPRGERHHGWLGDDATYVVAHQRVRAWRGSASTHPCADCGTKARHWSYDHADPEERTSDKGPYSLDPNRYVPRCVSCHKKFDCALLLQQRGTLSAIPRCGVSMRARKDNGPDPVCGRPEGHIGRHRSAEAYRRQLVRNRTSIPALELAS
jgi:hypothetical protein